MTAPPNPTRLRDGTLVWQFGSVMGYQFVNAAILIQKTQLFLTHFPSSDKLEACVRSIDDGAEISVAVGRQATAVSLADVRHIELLEFTRTMEFHGNKKLLQVHEAPTNDDFAQLQSVFTYLKQKLNAEESEVQATLEQSLEVGNQLWPLAYAATGAVGGWLAFDAPGLGAIQSVLTVFGWIVMIVAFGLLIYATVRAVCDRPNKRILEVRAA